MSTQREVETSYDVGNEFFRLWLDEGMSYSCALWENARTLEEAQLAKLAWHHDAAEITPEMRVLDVGCGWGANLEYLVRRRGVKRAYGITLSRAQLEEVQRRELPGVETELVSYRDFSPVEPFDRVISIGMLEHVATPEQAHSGEHLRVYRDYFDRIRSLTRPGARFALQLVQSARLPRTADHIRELAWATRAIFPGAIAPRIEDVVAALSSSWELGMMVTRRLDYAATSRAWLQRLTQNEARVRERFGDEIYLSYERYLRACVTSFERGYVTLGQYALRRID